MTMSAADKAKILRGEVVDPAKGPASPEEAGIVDEPAAKPAPKRRRGPVVTEDE